MTKDQKNSQGPGASSSYPRKSGKQPTTAMAYQPYVPNGPHPSPPSYERSYESDRNASSIGSYLPVPPGMPTYHSHPPPPQHGSSPVPKSSPGRYTEAMPNEFKGEHMPVNYAHPSHQHPHMPPPYFFPEHYWPPHPHYGVPHPPSMPPPDRGAAQTPYWGTTTRAAPASNASDTPVREVARMPVSSHAPIQPKPSIGGKNNQNNSNDVDGREGATSPSQIEISHRDEVQHMGCTCKKTHCLKLYCQCFGVKLYCGGNCRCFSCQNTRRYEKQRKEAMRAILSRNPNAFDTKFKKVPEAAVETSRPLTHKIGCKCRKSACMKKVSSIAPRQQIAYQKTRLLTIPLPLLLYLQYCECYAGNVKCSPSCRCMGCKNMAVQQPQQQLFLDSPSGRRDMHPPIFMPRQAPMAQYQPHVPSGPASHGGNGEPWMAAQNLTFLKRGSPSSAEKKRNKPATTDSSKIDSMPSLASSSDGTSPGDAIKEDESSEKEKGVNSLLMAAYAMTEFTTGDDKEEGEEQKESKRPRKQSPSKKEKNGSVST